MRIMIREYCEAWNAHDIEKMLSFFADDGILELVPEGKVAQDREQLKDELRGLFDDVPVVRLEWPAFLVTGEIARIRWILTAVSPKAESDLQGSGGSILNQGTTIVETQGDKIVRQATYWMRKLSGGISE